MRFSGRTALVTGAADGIGRAIVAVLRADGARVAVTDREPGGLEAEASFAAELTDGAFCDGLPGRVAEALGGLEILVNNAGVMREGTVEESGLEDWHLQLQVNLTAPFLLIRHAMPMLRAAGGAIVNVGSIEGLGSNPRHPAYGASKAGLHGLTRAVAVEHGQDGVRCNAVAPGWIDTSLDEDVIESMTDPVAFRAEIGGTHPVGRTGSASEVAELIVWLASDAASFVTGQVWNIDGGRMAQLSLP